jgi:biopolymer transport protein TolR
MGMPVGGERRGIVAQVNVVPLIDILLVLLVIFMIIPHMQMGLKAVVPQSSDVKSVPQPEVVVVQVRADGTLLIDCGYDCRAINQQPVEPEGLHSRLEEIFQKRLERVAFVRGDSVLEFAAVARVIDVMEAAGIDSVGLLTPELEKGR